MAGASQGAFDILLDIDRKSRQQAQGLPSQEAGRQAWNGITFQLGDNQLVMPVSMVVEAVTLPEVTRVPGVKSWVLGIANIRGNLQPIIDLKGFIYGVNSSAGGKELRVIIVEFGGHPAGLLVDAVVGIKHFWIDELVDRAPMVDKRMQPYVEASCSRPGQQIGIFSVARLLASEAFADVAV